MQDLANDIGARKCVFLQMIHVLQETCCLAGNLATSLHVLQFSTRKSCKIHEDTCKSLFNILTRIGVNLSVRLSVVRLSVTDVTSLPQRVLWERGYNVYRNAYAGNESPNSEVSFNIAP